MLKFLVLLSAAMMAATAAAPFPPPFSRPLTVQRPPLTGPDVIVLQGLLGHIDSSTPQTGEFDTGTSAALAQFQLATKTGTTPGALDAPTAARVLADLSADGYVDDGQPAAARGYLYKVVLPVHQNRSIETNATLYAGNGTALFTFTARAHGDNANAPSVWPNFNNTDPGLNMFSSGGNTPTGLMEFDLNSPEDNPQLYGIWDVNRAVDGLEGNAKFLLPNVRNGILMHTGEWPNWAPGQPMPNSEGCIHSWPNNIKTIAEILVNLGVVVRNNTDGKLPYPYKPQGLLSVQLID